jgi:hypothetical protein
MMMISNGGNDYINHWLIWKTQLSTQTNKQTKQIKMITEGFRLGIYRLWVDASTGKISSKVSFSEKYLYGK